MTDSALDTTNVLLGIMAAVSVLEAIAMIVVLAVVIRLYRQTIAVVRDVQRQIAPLAARVDDLAAVAGSALADVKSVTSRTAAGAEGVDAAVRTAMNLAGTAAGTAGSSIGRKAVGVIGIIKGVRAAYQSFTRRPSQPSGSEAQEGRDDGPTASDAKPDSPFTATGAGS